MGILRVYEIKMMRYHPSGIVMPVPRTIHRYHDLQTESIDKQFNIIGSTSASEDHKHKDQLCIDNPISSCASMNSMKGLLGVCIITGHQMIIVSSL